MRKVCKYFIAILCATAVVAGFAAILWRMDSRLMAAYNANRSAVVTDTNGKTLARLPNAAGYYNEYLPEIPADFSKLLVQKEDRWFYWHKGFNPISIIQALAQRIGLGGRTGSSTISQQLAKILLSQENSRTVPNKVSEIFYTMALETFNSKREILKMYANSAYFGNQLQGIQAAATGYFGTDASMLTPQSSLQLLAALNSPTDSNPATGGNIARAKLLAARRILRLQTPFTKKFPLTKIIPACHLSFNRLPTKSALRLSQSIRRSKKNRARSWPIMSTCCRQNWPKMPRP
jgi:membrane peptidoglycan carboxypeptidase